MKRRDWTHLLRWIGLHLVLGALTLWLMSAVLVTDRGDVRDPGLWDEIEALDPEVVFLGNSMLHDGLNQDLLQELLDDPRGGVGAQAPVVFKHALGGTYTAYWYLVLKNYVIAQTQPKLVLIFFRDPIPTYPTFRITGPYSGNVERVSSDDEPVYDRVMRHHAAATGDFGDRMVMGLKQVSPVYRERENLKEAFFDGFKSAADAWIPRGWPVYSDAVQVVLRSRAMATDVVNPDAPTGGTGGLSVIADIPAPEQVFAHEDFFHFDRVVDDSLLPQIVALCEGAGTQLIMVRMKKGPWQDWSDYIPADALEQYERDLDAWLEQQGVGLIDLSQDPSITPEMYRGVDHLGEEGREYLTVRFAAWLAAWSRLEQAALASGGGAPVLGTAAGDQLIAAAEAAWTTALEQPALASVVPHPVERPLDPAQFERVRRHLWKVAIPDLADDGNDDHEVWRSRWKLFEDGTPLGPEHDLLPAISKFGTGRFNHVGGELYFSTSDNSDPTTNGRSYVLREVELRLRR